MSTKHLLTISLLLPLVADICDGPRGLDDHGQELLAERGHAERTNQSRWLAERSGFCLSVRPE